MVDKRESYTKEDLLASGRGELFGAKGPQLPAPSMLMMDRVIKMSEPVATTIKVMSKQSSISTRTCGSSVAHFIGDPVMPGCLGLTQCGSSSASIWAGSAAKARPRAGRKVKLNSPVRYADCEESDLSYSL
ncbi:3-hydroxydecanoyl-[acyl-carrier-protein] dehydratase [Raoultella terrigena]|uniref:3-hydroxydecanoyl-[acyl-carrier-protein] dehydratase n=1 Tax=Raoultella terrigena TaxID=577 RepID=A0A4U9D9I7_RAOTE|nr:3-hydroxydecanoyl-[acyl-carrier-protein] dehydratase [Raoultella terrigena]